MTIENICLSILYDGQGNIWHGLFKEETYFVGATKYGHRFTSGWNEISIYLFYRNKELNSALNIDTQTSPAFVVFAP